MNFDIKKSFRGKPKNKVGLDIGSSAVKMLEISYAEEKNSLVCIGFRNVSSAVKEPLIEAIKYLADEIRITTREVNVSVSGPSVIVRFVSMPKMKDDELKSAIRFEAEKYIPFAIDDCIVDYQLLKKNDKEGKFDVLLVAVKKNIIMDRIALIEEAGFSVGVIDVDSFAVANAFFRNFPSNNANDTAALVNIGSKITSVSIVRNNGLCFVRDVVIGGNDFDLSISKALNIDMKAAEALKSLPADKSQEVIKAVRPVANSLVDEMRLSFSYYENQFGSGIDDIYISGGSSGLLGLDAAFRDAFDSSPSFWNPLEFLDKSSPALDINAVDKIKGSFAVAAGLALR